MHDPNQRPPDSHETETPLGDLLPLVYEELRHLAHRKLQGRGPGARLDTTALVHEAWLKIGQPNPETRRSRSHFLAVAAMAMRQVMSNFARDENADKRGGGWERVTLSHAVDLDGDEKIRAVVLADALDTLSRLNERHGRLATLRLVGGLSLAETAEALEVSLSTVERDWRFARSWLSARLA